jgi:hypothetical protein
MFYLPLFGLVTLLLILFFWALRRPRLGKSTGDPAAACEEPGQRHITFLPQIRQALEPADLAYLASRGSEGLPRRVRKERRRVAFSYIGALQGDFQRLLRLARVIAVLSPKVGAVHEFERLRLSVQFACRCEMLRFRLLCRLAPLPQLSGLGHMVSAFAVRMQAAMNELGERAAMAADLAASLEGRGIDPR